MPGIIGDTLTTYIGDDPIPVVTNRITTPPPPESTDDFIDRHCRSLLARVRTSGASVLKNTELSVSLARANGQSDESFVADFCVLLKAAA